ncbi:hypothetical protein Cni_G17765 [Canna indica]|uniref:Trichohyalin n=1 Tax=Canna indica TaxID=4628 RepID=A0AAQ3KI29_9LILI|nr:hypothetical protein Cni_G17765 [Canna indica]
MATATPTTKMGLTEEEMTIDDGLGYPKAYAKLCRNPSVLNPYAQGPPLTFLPYTLKPQEAMRAKDLNQMFPIIDSEAIPSVNPRGFANLLWKQLDHLGNAGFDPALFRVDPYGNVLYLNADSASPLSWDIDHWFPCSRGGRTVPSNLRLLQWQVCKKKHNKLEFLIPWWDLQLGISVNQFLAIFASQNSDFRNRAFSFLFRDAGSEELNALQAMDAHIFPQHFVDMEQQIGPGPAAIVSSRKGFDASVLRPLDANRSSRPNYPLIGQCQYFVFLFQLSCTLFVKIFSFIAAARKFIGEEEDDVRSIATNNSRSYISKENNHPNMETCDSNPYLSIAMARDSLRQREETKKKQAEINRLEDELNELKQQNEEGRFVLQELEDLLIRRRRRVEKSRRLSEAQSAYKSLLEKMIRDAMHQTVVYKEQARLNQAATSALMARLEAQRAICDSSENDLHRKFKQRDEIEKQIRPVWELRKRSRIDDSLLEEGHDERIRLSCTGRTKIPLQKELRIFLEEEQKASEGGLSPGEDEETDATTTTGSSQRNGSYSDDLSENKKLKNLAISMENNRNIIQLEKKFVPQTQENEIEESRTVMDEKLKQLAINDQYLSKTVKPKKKISLHPGSQEEAAEGHIISSGAQDDMKQLTNKPRDIETEERCSLKPSVVKIKIPVPQNHCKEDDDYCNQIGKGSMEKWLQILGEGSAEGPLVSTQKKPDNLGYTLDDEIIQKMNSINPQKEVKLLRLRHLEEKAGFVQTPRLEQKKNGICSKSRNSEVNVLNKSNDVTGVCSIANTDVIGSRNSFEVKDPRSESSRGFRSLPSSPSMILGMRRGMEFMGKKSKVHGDDDNGKENIESTSNNKFIKSCSKAIKRVINI